MKIESSLALKILQLMLSPVVRYCLRHSLRVQDALEALKAQFIELAAAQIERDGDKATDSALCVITGIHRRDIVRLRNGAPNFSREHDIVTKVIGQWESDKRWRDKKGKPRSLSCGAEHSEFSTLVKLITNDISPASVLLELERAGGVQRSDDTITLKVQSYIPKGNALSGFRILSDDYNDLLSVVEDNISQQQQIPHLHFRTSYDKVDSTALNEIRLWFLEQGREFHLKARQYLAQYDLDITPRPDAGAIPARVALSTFSYIQEGEEQETTSTPTKVA
jgi:hypothetical protein